jgi:hypothetical protein
MGDYADIGPRAFMVRDAPARGTARAPPWRHTDREVQHRAAPDRAGEHGHHGIKNRRTTYGRMGLLRRPRPAAGPRCG